MLDRITRQHIVITTLLAMAFLPVISWFIQRLGNGSGEPMGFIPLTIALILAFRARNPTNLRLAEISLLLYGIGIFFLPPLLRSLPALATIAFLTGMHRSAGQFGLLILALPIQASLDFFLGYPFRVITAEGARSFVNFLGYAVDRTGVQLSLKGVIVSVDPPCSGLQMLWATALLTALLAALFRLNYRRTLYLSIIALTLCLLANILRATALFFPESGMISLPGFAHEGIGLLFFAGAAALLVACARRISKRQPRQKISPNISPKFPRRFVALTCGVVLTTLLPARTQTSESITAFPEITHYQGRAVEEIPLSPREESFARNLPGTLKTYRVGQDTLIIRQLTRASRMLHPSYHCLRAEGFKITNSIIVRDLQGRASLQYEARLNDEHFLVTEHIRDLSNTHQWTEVSAWFWHALFHPNSGPWEAETLMLPLH